MGLSHGSSVQKNEGKIAVVFFRNFTRFLIRATLLEKVWPSRDFGRGEDERGAARRLDYIQIWPTFRSKKRVRDRVAVRLKIGRQKYNAYVRVRDSWSRFFVRPFIHKRSTCANDGKGLDFDGTFRTPPFASSFFRWVSYRWIGYCTKIGSWRRKRRYRKYRIRSAVL